MSTTEKISENRTISDSQNQKIPVWEKVCLTIAEAAEYSNIGISTMQNLCRQTACPFVLRVGNKKLVKRKEFEKFLAARMAI